jgi:integrase
VVRYLAVLSHVFTIAVKEYGWVDDNPFRKVVKPKEPRGRVRFLDKIERERLLEACRGSHNPHLYLIVILALSTGMRQSEILNLLWRDVDLERARIVLHETKNGERRVVPLAGHALELLKKYREQSSHLSLLFPRPTNPLRSLDLRSSWEYALHKAQIFDFKFHDLRHTAASYLAMNGASLAEIAEILGHKTLQMVKRYAHHSEAHTAGVVSRMNQEIFGQL